MKKLYFLWLQRRYRLEPFELANRWHKLKQDFLALGYGVLLIACFYFAALFISVL